MTLELEGTHHKFEPFQVSAPHVIYVVLGLFIVIVRVVSWKANSSMACFRCLSKRSCILVKLLLQCCLVLSLVCGAPRYANARARGDQNL